MNKLKLRLDDLQVDTFQTTLMQKEKGTVYGEQEWTYYYMECQDTWQGSSCEVSCFGSCDASCNGTCEGTCEQSCHGTCFETCDFYCGPSEGGYNCATSPYPNQPCYRC
jgi:modification target Cys-rich repeat protein